MCHYLIPFYRADYGEKCYMLYGHVHTAKKYDILSRLRQEIIASHTENHHAWGQFINVGCMILQMGHALRTLDELLRCKELL